MGNSLLEKTSEKNGPGREIANDVLCLKTFIVNVCLIGTPSSNNGEWVLVDAGMGNSDAHIIKAAEERFGKNCILKAIILTHGHFDHIGAITELCKRWDVPVYAHTLELPYLTGKADYPLADPSVGGGLMARISPMYPREAINLGNRVHPLPEDGGIPFMPGWRWVPTPGHTTGHISLYRDSDRILIAGDAFTTVKQESALSVLTQDEEINGPPAYFTPDWDEAWKSVKRLESLKPSAAVTGHGIPLSGEELSSQLESLARDFDRIAIPEHGRYVK